MMGWRRLNFGLCSIVAVTASLAVPAIASDYSNECKSTDGAYVAQDGVLYRAKDKKQQVKLTYSIIEEQVLEEHRSFCVPSNAEAQGQKFENYSRKAQQKIEVDDRGQVRKATLVCELATSGLPAAYNCAKEIKGLSRKTPGPVQSYALGAPGTWSHNGSVMRLEANGNNRRLIYMNPRVGLRHSGVSADTTLFDGERQGDAYTGTARYFSKACGEKTFPVTGKVLAGETRIELSGLAPKVDETCKVIGTRTETLVFERAK